MKKIISVIISFTVMCLLLCSCQPNKNTKNSTEQGEAFLIYGGSLSSGGSSSPASVSENESFVTVTVENGNGLKNIMVIDKKSNAVSDEFYNVVACNGTLVAYIDGFDTENSTLVIRKIFKKKKPVYQTEIEFGDVNNPIINAEFTDDNSLTIDYINSENCEAKNSIRF